MLANCLEVQTHCLRNGKLAPHPCFTFSCGNPSSTMPRAKANSAGVVQPGNLMIRISSFRSPPFPNRARALLKASIRLSSFLRSSLCPFGMALSSFYFSTFASSDLHLLVEQASYQLETACKVSMELLNYRDIGFPVAV